MEKQVSMEEFNDNSSAQESSSQDTRDDFPSVEYAGFWIRFLASVLDSVLLLMVLVPLLLMFYGPGVLFVSESPGLAYDVINYALPIIAVVIFWQYRAATPGKMIMDIYIVDADTLRQPSFGRLILRYLGYYVSMIPLFLGFFWIGWDKRKQGFHDKIAKTLVIKESSAVVTSDDYVQKQLGEQGAYADKPKPVSSPEPASSPEPINSPEPGTTPDPWKE